MTHKVPASNVTWKTKENNMPYLDITEDLYGQLKYIINQNEISSFNTYISSEDTFVNLFGNGKTGGFVTEIKKHVENIIASFNKELDGDSRLYRGVACSRYFCGIKKNGKLYFSPMGFNYELSSEEYNREI